MNADFNPFAGEKPAFEGLDVIRADQISSEQPDWLWPGYLLKGRLTLLVGQPGSGKKNLTTELAAMVAPRLMSNYALQRPCVFPAGLRGVVIFPGIEGVSGNLRPRLEVAGADLSMIDVVRGTKDTEFFRFESDQEKLKELIEYRGNVQLVIIHSLDKAIARSAKNTEGREQVLRELLKMAKNYGFAILATAELTKPAPANDPLVRVNDSFGLRSLATNILLAARLDDASGQRPNHVVVPIKSGISDRPCGYEFQIRPQSTPCNTGFMDVSQVVWLGGIVDSPLQVFCNSHNKPSALRRAQDFLKNELTGMPQRVTDIELRAQNEGIAPATLRRAKDSLFIESKRIYTPGFDSSWYLSLPAPWVPPSAASQPASFFDQSTSTQFRFAAGANSSVQYPSNFSPPSPQAAAHQQPNVSSTSNFESPSEQHAQHAQHAQGALHALHAQYSQVEAPEARGSNQETSATPIAYDVDEEKRQMTASYVAALKDLIARHKAKREANPEMYLQADGGVEDGEDNDNDNGI